MRGVRLLIAKVWLGGVSGVILLEVLASMSLMGALFGLAFVLTVGSLYTVLEECF